MSQADYIIDKGLSEEVVRTISEYKNEPQWMTDIRLKAYQHFIKRPIPEWGNTDKLNTLDFEDICYFRVIGENQQDWDEVPDKNQKIPLMPLEFQRQNRNGSVD